MSDYLLEIGLEEVPARFCDSLTNLFKEKITQTLNNEKIIFKDIDVYMTYRRLVLLIQGLSDKQEDVVTTLTGPPKEIAFDKDGNVTSIGIGFMKKANITKDELTFTKDNKKRDILCAHKKQDGKFTKHCLQTIVPKVIADIPLAIKMRWGNHQGPFVRPVKWIVSLYNNECLNLEIFNIKSNRLSYGHRFLSQENNWSGKKLTITSALSFKDQLKKDGRVILDPLERKKLITQSLSDLQKREHAELIEELIYLCENPSQILASIPSHLTDIPKVVIETCIKKHQKYIPLLEKNNFEYLIITDNLTKSNLNQILSGNQKVLAARLKDAQFYWDKDKQSTLLEKASRLEAQTYIQGVGSLAEKQFRLKAISHDIAQKYGLNCKQYIDEVCAFLKADLASLMVQEFPNLQGIMGELYAQFEKKESVVSKALKEQYLPLNADSDCAQSPLGITLALADRFDHIVAAFLTNKNPTGSKDPLGIRRCVNAVIQTALKHKLNINFDDLLLNTYDQYQQPTCYHNDKQKIKAFILQRVKSNFEQKDLDYDCIEAVLDISFNNLYESYQKAKILQHLKHSDTVRFKAFVETARRLKRFIKSSKSFKIYPDLFEQSEEKSAYDHFKNLPELSKHNIKDLYLLIDSLIIYFDKVLISCENKAVSENRNAFIQSCSQYFNFWGDPELLVI